MKRTISFLESVAKAYVDRYDDLSETCFLFPNRRSCTFFLKALSESLEGRTMLAPETLSISDFMEKMSGREIASRIDILFRLYNVYRRLLGSSPDLSTEKGVLDFDRFAPWAETLVGDFSEVDQFDADADALFKNVRDYDSISSNFLSEEQLEILERYFGYMPNRRDLDSFWRTLLPEEDRTDLQLKFIELWKLMPELYKGLREDLEESGLAMEGSTFRIAAEKVAEEGFAVLPWRKIVVVGFNMLSTTEVKLFSELSKLRDEAGEPFADFYWDATGPVLSPELKVKSTATKAIARIIRNFPMPKWARPYLAESNKEDMPSDITIAASPSNSAQVKIAMMQVEEWLEREGVGMEQNPDTAIVVPDENLLLPLIHSLPEGVEHVNLTMGYSMRYTSVASLMYHLRRLQARIRKSDGLPCYYHEDLRIFLSHPLVQLTVGSAVTNHINEEIGKNHLKLVTIDWIKDRSETLSRMIQPVGGFKVAETIDYLSSVLRGVEEALDGAEKGMSAVNAKMERVQIEHYREALYRLLESVESNGIEMRAGGVFHLVDRLLAGETVTFEGEPLQGLQIMGLLETRALDFDRLIILSMNDKTMPQRSRRRTYIPEALRHAYGLPSRNRGEELSAYYFYRLLSRAKEVTLVYDARAGEGMRSGGKSRFLMQLEMLYGKGRAKTKTYSFGLGRHTPQVTEIEKTPAVMEHLEQFKADVGSRNLSASALINYCQCQVKFYYRNVMNLNDDSGPVDYVDSASQGKILHETMMRLYLPDSRDRKKYLDGRVVLTRERLEKLLEDEEKIHREVVRSVNEVHYGLPPEDRDRPIEGTVAMLLPRFKEQVRNVLRNDIRKVPIELVGCEISDTVRLKVGVAPEINVKFAFDRVDVAGGKLRILDYKTGKLHWKSPALEEIFGGNREASYLLQLFLYAYILEKEARPTEKPMSSDIEIMFVDVNAEGNDIEVRPTIGKGQVMAHSEMNKEFEEGLERLLKEIFDVAHPFYPNGDEDTCKFCSFKYLCGRE